MRRQSPQQTSTTPTTLVCRVGAWRLLDLLNEMNLPVSLLVNSEIYNQCPELPAEYCKQLDHCEVVGHGQSNACKQVLKSCSTVVL